jgi:16S rRNA processing protein RimM
MESAGHKTGGDFIPVGRITKPHGVRGELKVHPFTQSPENLKRYATLFLFRDGDNEYIPFVREKVRFQAKSVIIKLKGCDDRTQAEALVGCQVLIEKNELPAPGKDEFYLYQLEGKQAIDIKGKHIGTVTSVLVGHGQSLLQIDRDGKEVLVPLVAEFLVQRDGDHIVLDLPQGLLDVYQ